jgi:hypothetical protein
MKASSLIVFSVLIVAVFGCSKKTDTMTEEQAKAAGYTIVVTNAEYNARFQDHIVINGTNVPISSTNITVAPVKKD